MVFEKLVPSNVTSIHARNSVVHQKFCIELRHACRSRNSSEALPKIVAPLRERSSILLLLDEVPRCAVGREYPFCRLRRVHLSTETHCPHKAQDHFARKG